MIASDPTTEKCAVCDNPMADATHFVVWYLPRMTLVMHAGCASRLSKQLYSNVMNLYKQENEERTISPIDYHTHTAPR